MRTFLYIFIIISFAGFPFISKAGIDWEKGIIEVKGNGAPNLKAAIDPVQARLGAERVAKADAYRQLLEVLKGVQVYSSVTMEEKMKTNQSIMLKINGRLRATKVVNKDYYEDGGVEITLRAKIWDVLRPAFNEFDSAKASELKGPEKKYKRLNVIIEKSTAEKFKYSAMPSAVNKSGNLIFGPEIFPGNLPQSVHYLSKAPKKDPSSLELKVDDINNKGQLIFSDESAKEIMNKKINRSFLSAGQIFIFVEKK